MPKLSWIFPHLVNFHFFLLSRVFRFSLLFFQLKPFFAMRAFWQLFPLNGVSVAGLSLSLFVHHPSLYVEDDAVLLLLYGNVEDVGRFVFGNVSGSPRAINAESFWLIVHFSFIHTKTLRSFLFYYFCFTIVLFEPRTICDIRAECKWGPVGGRWRQRSAWRERSVLSVVRSILRLFRLLCWCCWSEKNGKSKWSTKKNATAERSDREMCNSKRFFILEWWKPEPTTTSRSEMIHAITRRWRMK